LCNFLKIHPNSLYDLRQSNPVLGFLKRYTKTVDYDKKIVFYIVCKAITIKNEKKGQKTPLSGQIRSVVQKFSLIIF